MPETPTTHQKALRINQDSERSPRFGTFAEIGAGQEVARWFFHVGKASATVAKSISAYDTTVSDEIYGHADHYVSRSRITAMLDLEYSMLIKRLDEKRGAATRFFVFAETVATHSRPHQAGGHGWLGIRFQTQPRGAPSEIMLHVQLLDPVTADAQDAIGKLGVNLIYGAFYFAAQPEQLIAGLMNDLSRERIEVDLLKFSGPAFSGVDNRLMSLKLIELRLTDVAMIDPRGDVIQPSEVLSGKPALIERGSFRPVTNVMLAMMDRALAQLRRESEIDGRECVELMEMTTHNLTDGGSIDPTDFLARADTLGTLGKTVMITSYRRFHEVVEYVRHYTGDWIVMAVGMPVLQEIFDEKYYTDLEGGILEAAGRFFKDRVKMYVYPMQGTPGGEVSGVESLEVPSRLRHLAAYLVENGFIEPITDFETSQLHISPRDVLAEMQQGRQGWEQLVPAPVAQLIKSRGLFGYQSGVTSQPGAALKI